MFHLVVKECHKTDTSSRARKTTHMSRGQMYHLVHDSTQTVRSHGIQKDTRGIYYGT